MNAVTSWEGTVTISPTKPSPLDVRRAFEDISASEEPSDVTAVQSAPVRPAPRPVADARRSAARRIPERHGRAWIHDVLAELATTAGSQLKLAMMVVLVAAVSVLWWGAFAHTYRTPPSPAPSTAAAASTATASTATASTATASTPAVTAPGAAAATVTAGRGRLVSSSGMTDLRPTAHVPTVVLQRYADFSAGDPLPDGARTHDNGGVSVPMAIVAGRLSHAGSAQAGAASWLETQLSGDVKVLGARIDLAPRSESVVLTAWQSSVVDAAPGADIPATGMRLLVRPDGWIAEVMTSDKTIDVVGQGAFDAPVGAFSIEVLRRGDRLWVVDPTGHVTTLSDPRISSLAGPWASWELRETGARQRPAAIEAVWAG